MSKKEIIMSMEYPHRSLSHDVNLTERYTNTKNDTTHHQETLQKLEKLINDKNIQELHLAVDGIINKKTRQQETASETQGSTPFQPDAVAPIVDYTQANAKNIINPDIADKVLEHLRARRKWSIGQKEVEDPDKQALYQKRIDI